MLPPHPPFREILHLLLMCSESAGAVKANVAENVLEFWALVSTDVRRAMVMPAALKMGERLLNWVAERYLLCESEILKEWERICLSCFKRGYEGSPTIQC